MEPDAFQEYLKMNEKRSCVLDTYRDFVESRLQLFPETSSAQMLDWLKENNPDLPAVHPKTAYNFVMRIRQDYGIPKVAVCSRQYAAVPELPPGEQAQVDFGQIKLRTSTDTRKTIHFFSMLLCHCRMKFLIARETPFTAQSAVDAHEKAFEYFQGMPRQIVYDQDFVFLSKENLGDLIMTDIFNRYQAGRPFKVLFCRAADPESKGKIENVVKFIKQNFLYNRQYVDEVTINSQAIDWLRRTGNGMRHNTTCKIPYEEWLTEREHLLAWNPLMRIEQTEYHKVIKTNTVRYKGNTYSLPLGTYKNENSRVFLKEADGRLLIHDENGLLVAIFTALLIAKITALVIAVYRGLSTAWNNQLMSSAQVRIRGRLAFGREDWLSYNRYSYCLNNPLKYTDPSGNIIPAVVGVVIDAVVLGGGTAFVTSVAMGSMAFDNGGSFWGSFSSSFIPGVLSSIASSSFTYGIGSAFSHTPESFSFVREVSRAAFSTPHQSDH